MDERSRVGWPRVMGGVVRRVALGASVAAVVAASVIGLDEWADAHTVAPVPHSVHDTPPSGLG